MKIHYRPDRELVDERGRPMVAVPAWLFDDVDGECTYYLLRIQGSEGMPDGCHTDPQDVAIAKRLIESIDAISKRPDRRYVMLQILPVPERAGSVNQDAIDTLNAAHRSARAKP